MTERGVREVERRAIQKLRSDPLLRHIWREYLAGQLDEQQLTLTSDEIGALFNLARTPAERHVIQKVLRLIHGRRRQ
jgi:5'-deoxynucleotidase YfbR-like HD superfamily hydrolase